MVFQLVSSKTFGFAVLLHCSAVIFASAAPSFDTVFEWKYIDYDWPSPKARRDAVKSGQYIPENNVISGIKIWKDKAYLTTPRMRTGVPVSLSVISAAPENPRNAPELVPYPNWEMQTLGDCDAFQFVQAVEIDPRGRMWVLDNGRTNTMGLTPVAKCPPRLVILDLKNNGAVLRTHVFPKNVVAYLTVLLDDLVLDHRNGGMAFIADADSVDPGIVVYSLRDNESWKIRNARTMRAQVGAIPFAVNGTPLAVPFNVDGIALSPPGRNRQLYYCPLSSYHLYRVPVEVLRNRSFTSIDNYVVDLGVKKSQADGMMMSNTGVIYTGLLQDDAVARWNTRDGSEFSEALEIYGQDHTTMQWQDGFALDDYGRLWCVTNALQRFVTFTLDITEINFRLVRRDTGTKSYQYLRNGRAPRLPEIARSRNAK
ncbi:major royal jelly protein 3-like [Athalia rosae]|uniref:major royal jelly protein 3-like n=1 Tax=Athalia rosae TaxID=37344 RepID=UPI002034973E|nr:major royal jelly protein 3-like [Athalia rosae]